MNSRIRLPIMAFGFGIFAAAATAEETVNLNVVSYQTPPGLFQLLETTAPSGVTFNQKGWPSVSDADIIL